MLKVLATKEISGENSRHFVTSPLVSPRNDVCRTRAEIPFWWSVTTQVWVVAHHEYEISARIPRTLFRWETGGDIANCRLVSEVRNTFLVGSHVTSWPSWSRRSRRCKKRERFRFRTETNVCSSQLLWPRLRQLQTSNKNQTIKSYLFYLLEVRCCVVL